MKVLALVVLLAVATSCSKRDDNQPAAPAAPKSAAQQLAYQERVDGNAAQVDNDDNDDDDDDKDDDDSDKDD